MNRVVFEPPAVLGEPSAPSAGNKRQRRAQASTLVQFPQEVLVYSGDDERSLRNRGRKGRNAYYDVLGLIVLTGCVVRDVADLKSTEWGHWRSKHYAHLIADDPEAFVEWSFTDLQAFDKETHGAHKSVDNGAFIGTPNLFVNGKPNKLNEECKVGDKSVFNPLLPKVTMMRLPTSVWNNMNGNSTSGNFKTPPQYARRAGFELVDDNGNGKHDDDDI